MGLTTCALDCFDGCSIEFSPQKLKGDPNHPITKGYLCPHLNHWFKHPRITNARIGDEAVPLDEAIEHALKILTQTPPEKTLFYKGSGNLGLMQQCTKDFFAKRGAVIAKGSLCDEAGNEGIIQGRGKNLALSPTHVEKADVVVLWGRNINTCNSHMLPVLKNKIVILIDPIKSYKNPHLHLSLKPKGDIALALLLSRITYMEEAENIEYIKARSEGFDDYKEIFLWTPIRLLAQQAGVSMDEAALFLNLVKGKKVAILVGTAVQRYAHGATVLRAIDSLALMHGWLGGEGSGVGYLSDSSQGVKQPFQTISKRSDSLVNVDFGKYETVIIQGGNPASQMPSSKRVIDGLKKVKNLIYFGLHVNATSELANVVLPAKSFLEKDDLKCTYGHEFIGLMPKMMENSEAISEYELTQKLLQKGGFESLPKEADCINMMLHSISDENVPYPKHKLYKTWPYKEGFYTDSGRFIFPDELSLEPLEGEVYLIFSKWHKALNSQFYPHDSLHVSPHLGLIEGEQIRLKSQYSEAIYSVSLDDRLPKDVMLLYSGAKNANALTPPFEGEEGHTAIYQEMAISWERV
jgi:anaerobic selenocysteine-containing dehydrogenase